MRLKARRSPHRSKPQLKYQRVREALREQIQAGTLRPGSQLPPERELPRLFRVSELTVRRALTDLAREGWIVRRRRSGSFVVDRRQPPLLPGRTLRLGILCAHSLPPQWLTQQPLNGIAEGILNEWGLAHVTPTSIQAKPDRTTGLVWRAPDRGLSVELLGEAAGTDHRHPSLRAVQERGYDGIITQSIVEESWLEKLLALKIPTVIADFSKPRFAREADQVYFDPQEGYGQAVRHLVQQGFRRIHFVGCVEPAPAPDERRAKEAWLEFSLTNRRVCLDSFARLNVFRQELLHCCLELPNHWIHLDGSTKEVAEKLVRLPEEQRPEAVVCHNLYQVEHIKRVFAAHGHSIVGVGSSALPPSPLTQSVWADSRAMGASAAALLLSRLQRPARPTLRVGVTMYFSEDAKDLKGSPRAKKELCDE